MTFISSWTVTKDGRKVCFYFNRWTGALKVSKETCIQVHYEA